MSDSTTKKCNSCGKIVDPKHLGECPHCGEKKGYAISVSINEYVSVKDVVHAYTNSMKDALGYTLKKYDELGEQHKKNKELKKRIEELKKKLTDKREELISKSEADGLKKATKTFTIDTIIGTEEQRKQYFEKSVKSKVKQSGEKSTNDLLQNVILNQTITTGMIENIENRLSHKETILLGLGIGVIGSIIGGFIVYFMTGIPIVPVESADFIDVTVNTTNSTHP